MNNITRDICYKFLKYNRIIVKIISVFIINRDKRRDFRRSKMTIFKKFYLSQYLYSINQNYDMEQDDIKKQDNKIWICWLQGEKNAPDIVKACINSVRRNKPNNMEIIILTSENLKNFIKIPDYVLEKFKNGIIDGTHFSDIIRVAILAKHGGIWIDSTVFLTGKVPQQILKSNFFAFHANFHGYNSNNWFLRSKYPSNTIIIAMRNFHYEYWKNEDKVFDYFMYHFYFDTMIAKNKLIREEWEKVPLFWDYDCYDFGDVYLLEKYDKKIFNDIVKKSTIHKLKYKYDKTKKVEGTFLEKFLNYDKL
jgi:hypothetical protein